jgi:hypothetical protein
MDRQFFTFLLAVVFWQLAIPGSRSLPAQTSQDQKDFSAAQSASSQNVQPAISSVPTDQANARKARAIIEAGIQALGGQAYLAIHDIEQEGRTYSFYHGRPTSAGTVFWRFVEYPDKERIEVTKERDIAYVWVGNKGYEITYKGPHEVKKEELDDYLRRRKFSLETVLRSWVNDPGVALFYEGHALAGNVDSEQVTLINAKDEAVTLYFDIDNHWPIKKSFSWRDPVDRQKNLEEEIYANYRAVQGIMTPYDFTRYYNGDMAAQRFVNNTKYNGGLNEVMFDPNSGYNPNKPTGKH